MAGLAKVSVAAAPACPNCKNRLPELPLDELAAGDEYQCIFCSQVINIPKQVLERLIEQRDARLREEAANRPGLWTRIRRFFGELFGAK